MSFLKKILGKPASIEKSSDSLYLDKLEFNPALRRSFLNFFVSNFRVVILLIFLLTGWGVYSYINLPVENNPEVKIPIAVVITSYPGASPADVEELVSKKIETSLSGVKDVKKVTSRSANSISSITVEFDADADLDDSIRKLRDQVTSVQAFMPTDANDSVVREISMDDTPIFTAALAGPFDGFTLRRYAEDIQDELEKIPGVREVNVSGGDQAEFEVAYDPAKLIQYGISADQANSAIKSVNLAVPAGSFKGEQFVFPVRADARFYDSKTLENLPLLHTDEGAFVFLKDIATVREKAIERTILSRFSSGGERPQSAVTLSIVKKTGGNVLQTSDQAQAKIQSMLKSMPESVRYDVTVDTSKQIRQNFDQLVHDFFMTIALVFGILLLVIGLKEALVAGLAVPLVFFATFGVMLMTGISLNFLSMFSLILALGLLVDDAIVVVSATKQYLKTGKYTPEEAVLLVLNDFKVVLTTTTLTTVWAFLPLLAASGIMGQFIKSIPITVSVTLLSSLVIALVINHPLAAVLERIRMGRKMFLFTLSLPILALVAGLRLGAWGIPLVALSVFGIHSLVRWYRRGGRSRLLANEALVEREWRDDDLIKRKLKGQGSHESNDLMGRLLHGVLHFDSILPHYEKALNRILATRKTRLKTLAFAFALFIAAVLLPATGVVPSEFFPVSDMESVFVNIEAPTGSRLEETDQIVTQVERKLLAYPEISNFSTIVGSGAAGGSLTSSSGAGAPSDSAAITLRLVDEKDRKLKSYEFSEILRKDLASIKGGTITVETLRGGPPSGSAFEARIRGDDLQTLDKIAHELEPLLAAIPGVANTDISLKGSPADFTFKLDPIRLEFHGLNAAYVGSMLRMAISGTEVTTVLREGDETKVVARFDKAAIPTLADVQNLQLLNLKKQPVFLKDVATVELEPSVESITRIDQKRTVLLSAGVSGTTRPNEVLAAFQKALSQREPLPAGYDIVYGGENETNQESVLSILRAMLIAALLIVSTLVIQFNSFKKALIVIVTIPLALIGVFFGMAVIRVTLSFPGLIGIVALFGIVVKNAIILMDKINLNLKHGIPFKTAIVDAGKSRLEAIVITSLCTIVGILPVTLSNGTWMALGSAVIFGLMVSSFLTLFIVPTLFVTFIRDGERF